MLPAADDRPHSHTTPRSRVHGRGWVAPALAAVLVFGCPTVSAKAKSPLRITGGSISLGETSFPATVHVEGDPQGKVARVMFSIEPACASDPEAGKYAGTPEVSAAPTGRRAGERVFEAEIPDPSRGAVGSWVFHARAVDRGGLVLARYESQLTRAFPVKWKALAFRPPRLDTSARGAEAELVIELEHDTPITGLGLVTSTHDNPTLDLAPTGGALEMDRRRGAMTGLHSRIERRGPMAFSARFSFPANAPELKLSVERIFLRDARCRTAEDSVWGPIELAVTSGAPRAIGADVELDPTELARGRVQIRFRHLGPATRTYRAPNVGNMPAPIVDVVLWNPKDPARPLLRARAAPVRASPLDEHIWDGSSMSTPPVPASVALLALIRAGVDVELDDGGLPAIPRVPLPAR